MCMDHKFKCKCADKEINFEFKNEILPHEVVASLYCPNCSGDMAFDPKTMVADNGWIIEYDMDVARFMSNRMPNQHAENLTPEVIFDNGYCSWLGVYPDDQHDSAIERERIMAIAKINPTKYLTELKDWANSRMDRLKQQGWRKANERFA